MKNKLLLFSLVLAASQSFGQTTIFETNFDPTTQPSAPYTASAQYGSLFTTANSSTVSDAKATYVGYTNQPSGWYAGSANGGNGLNNMANSGGTSLTSTLGFQTSANTPVGHRGAMTAAIALSQLPLMNPKLNLNTGTITWAFSMRINKSSSLTPLASCFNDNNNTANSGGAVISGGMILTTNGVAGTDIQNSAARGYAVIMHGAGTATGSGKNKVTFGRFDGGLLTDTAGDLGVPLSPSTFTGLLSVDNIGTGASSNPVDRNTCSIKVTYTVATNTWTMQVRNEADTTTLQDPYDTSVSQSYVTSTPASIVDAVHTTITNTNMMAFFNSGATQGMYVDYLSVKSSENLGLSNNEIEGLSIYPNPVVNGVLNITTSSDSVKEVAIYNLLGSKVADKEVNAGSINLSGIANGVYVIKITEAGKTSIRKIIVQ